LPSDRIPTTAEIINTDRFNTLKYKDMGRIIYRGTDDEGNKVFTLGRGTSKALLPSLQNLATILKNDCGMKERIILSNMSPTVTVPMTIGGFFARGLKINFIGVPLLVIGVKRGYKRMVKVVNKTKETARSSSDQIMLLMNKEMQV